MEDLPVDTPVEELPGILGYKFDDYDFISLSYSLSSILPEFVHEFDYEVAYLDKELNIELKVDGKIIELIITNGDSLALLLGYFPSLRVTLDCPPNQGMTSGVGLLVFLENGFTEDQAKAHVELFITAMRRNLVLMQSLNK
jgi:hypothetical protein